MMNEEHAATIRVTLGAEIERVERDGADDSTWAGRLREALAAVTPQTREIWVCLNCLHLHANGVDLRTESEGGNPDDPRPWSQLIDAHEHAAMNSCGTCPDDCDHWIRFGDFGRATTCDGCGLRDDGSRYRFAWFL